MADLLYIIILQVLQDMLQLLKESASSSHAERLEQIVIILIGLEIGNYTSLHSRVLDGFV